MENKEKALAKEISEEVVKEIKKEMPKFSLGRTYNIVKDVVTIIMIALVLFFGLKINDAFDKNTSVVKPVEDQDLTIENHGFLGFTAADFENVIVGAASRKALLIVDEQELSDATTITKAGLFNLGVFSKNQVVTYYGMGQYTVDLSKINNKSITVDDESHTVTVKIPHVELHEVFFDASKTVFGTAEKGLLAFGDIKLTVEESNEIEKEAINRLTIRAKENDCMEKADKYALYVLRDFFETAISEVTNTYKVKVEFVD